MVEHPALWIAFRDTPGLRCTEAAELLRAYRHPARIFGRPVSELEKLCGREVARCLARAPSLTRAGQELSRATAAGMEIVTQSDDGFPQKLRELTDPPVLLYVAGRLPPGPFVSVVGSRRPSARSLDAAVRFAAALARAGLVVASGLAYGIDAAAHRGALEARGRTVAVLASGLDRAGPRGNRGLARRILHRGGAWLSEYPPGTAARARHFPDRNRLISGLSSLTFVVEARERSGSLWTARHAADQGRDVAVVPGPIDEEGCRGSNRLLVDGATPVVDESGLLVAALGRLDPELSIDPAEPCPLPGGDAGRIVRRIREAPCGPEELVAELGLTATQVASLLFELEVEGFVTREGRRIATANRRGRDSGPRG